jgi:hypothetical protein
MIWKCSGEQYKDEREERDSRGDERVTRECVQIHLYISST